MQIEHASRMRSVLWLHLGFALTGMGTTLLGCALPTLSTTWHMSDSRAGVLFAAQFSGSALGALLVGNDFFVSVVRGYLLLIASAVSIAFFTDFFPVLRLLSFGLGLGFTMTATSMLIGAINIGKRGSALSLLNASWALGAALSPAIASFWTRRWPPVYLFFAFGAVLVVVLANIARDRKSFLVDGGGAPESRGGHHHLRFVFVFAVLASLYVGVEACISGWMMTYVHRLPIVNQLWAPIATSFFWLALLCGRMLAPAVLRRISEAQLLNLSLMAGLTSAVFLLFSRTPLGIVLSAGSAGLMIGPIFPLCLSKALAFMSDSPKTKWVFSISGTGGAVLPWMTGKLSAHSGSLRVGLIVPVFALGAMIIVNRLAPAPNQLRLTAEVREY
jgi:MFS transporter, FHS family, glucose/mannose:H+ symporter